MFCLTTLAVAATAHRWRSTIYNSFDNQKSFQAPTKVRMDGELRPHWRHFTSTSDDASHCAMLNRRSLVHRNPNGTANFRNQSPKLSFQKSPSWRRSRTRGSRRLWPRARDKTICAVWLNRSEASRKTQMEAIWNEIESQEFTALTFFGSSTTNDEADYDSYMLYALSDDISCGSDGSEVESQKFFENQASYQARTNLQLKSGRRTSTEMTAPHFNNRRWHRKILSWKPM